jgi:hypothetical protein
MTTESLASRLASIQLSITRAEADLEKALRETQSAPRAEKINISERLEVAFATLRNAKAALLEVEALIADADD